MLNPCVRLDTNLLSGWCASSRSNSSGRRGVTMSLRGGGLSTKKGTESMGVGSITEAVPGPPTTKQGRIPCSSCPHDQHRQGLATPKPNTPHGYQPPVSQQARPPSLGQDFNKLSLDVPTVVYLRFYGVCREKLGNAQL